MKINIAIITFLLFGLSVPLSAESWPRNVFVSLELVYTVEGAIYEIPAVNIQTEFRLYRMISGELGFRFLAKNYYSAFAPNLGIKFYIFEESLNGLWLGSRWAFVFGWDTLFREQYYQNLAEFLVGYKFVLGDTEGLCIDPNLGISFTFPPASGDSGIIINPVFAVNFGYSF